MISYPYDCANIFSYYFLLQTKQKWISIIVTEIVIYTRCAAYNNTVRNYYDWDKWTKFLLQSYMGHLDDIQTAPKPLYKFKYIFMTIIGLAESVKAMNRSGPTRPQSSLMAYFSESIKDKCRNGKFWHNLHSILQFLLLKFGIDILDSLKTKRFSAT